MLYADMSNAEKQQVRIYGATESQLRETIDSYNEKGQTDRDILLRLMQGVSIMIEDADDLAYQQLNRAIWMLKNRLV
jgi:hypothetical protein